MTLTDAEKLIDRFEVAAYNHDALGSIPVFSGDAEEQRAINRELQRIKTNYTRTRNALIKALTDV